MELEEVEVVEGLGGVGGGEEEVGGAWEGEGEKEVEGSGGRSSWRVRRSRRSRRQLELICSRPILD